MIFDELDELGSDHGTPLALAQPNQRQYLRMIAEPSGCRGTGCAGVLWAVVQAVDALSARV